MYKLVRPLTAGLFFCALLSAQVAPVQIRIAPAGPQVNTLVGVDPQPGISFQQAAAGGIGGNLVGNNNIYTVGWSLPAAATNVTISAFVSPGASITAYLTTHIGQGTTVQNEIASTSFTGVSGGSNDTTTVFNGLNLAAGTYYLTLAGSVASNAPNAPSWYALPNAPGPYITNSAGGVTGLFQGAAGIAPGAPVAPYPPASTFLNLTPEQQTGNPTWNALLFDVVSVQNSALPAATALTPYSATLTATGGIGSYTWSALLATGAPLPAWLSIDPSSGSLSGTPPASGTLALTVTATDVQSNTGHQGMSLPINIAGRVLNANLPSGMALVNISGTQDLSNHANGNLTWDQPFSSAGQLVEYTLPAGMYTFRVIDPADATALFPSLTQAQTNFMWTAWTFNSPWVTGWLAFDSSALANNAETQLFSGADAGPGLGNAAAAYADAITNGYENSLYPLIRTATSQKTWYFPNPTTLIFSVPDDQGGDNQGGVSVLIAPAAAQALNISTESLNSGQVGVAYGPFNMAATGGSGNYSWSATGLPPGLTLSAAGVLSGTPAHIGNFNVTLTVTDPVSGRSVPGSPIPITMAPPTPALTMTTEALPPGEAGRSYSATVAAIGGFGAYTWSISNGAPLLIDPSTGALSSNGPLAGGNLPQFTVTVADAAGDSVSQTFTVTVDAAVSITTAAIPNASLNESYGVQLSAANGTGDNTWVVSAGALPAGLILNPNGIISGKATSTISFGFTAQVTDSSGGTATQALSLTVTQPISYVVVNRDSGTLSVTGDGATVSTLSNAASGRGIARDAGGNFVVASPDALQRVTPSGATSTIASTSGGASWLGVAIDPAGNYIATDNSDHEIWRISPDGATQNVVAAYPVSNPGNAEDAYVAVDTGGNYIVAHDNTAPVHIVKITPDGRTVTNVALSGAVLPTSVGGLTLDANGNYIVLDWTQSELFQITPAGVVSVFATGLGSQALGIARNPLTGEYIVGVTTGILQKVSANGQVITTLANDSEDLTHPEGVVAVPNDYPAGVAATNPLGYFRMETSSGTSEVNNYTFTMTGGATVATPGAPIASPANNFAALDGAAGQVVTNLAGGITTAGSIAAWVNLAVLPSSQPSFSYIAGESQVGNDFDLQFDNSNNNVLRFYTTSGGQNISYTPDATTLVGQWHFIVATFDATASTRALYWDGALVNSDTVTSQANKTTTFQVGSASPTFDGRNFNGGIDEVAVWNYALSPAQVYQMFITRGPASGNSISLLTPSSAPVNSGATTLTVNGTGFAQGSTVRWTSPAGQTSFLTPTGITAPQITATIPANLLASAGVAEVSVVNPAGVPGNELPFSVAGFPALSITPANIPDATVGVQYSRLLSAGGGSGNFSWSLNQDDGLNFTITPVGEGLTATLSGVPTAVDADAHVSVTLTDLTTTQTVTNNYTFAINATPPPFQEPSGITAWVINEDGSLVSVTNGEASQIVSGSGCDGCYDIARDAAGNLIVAAGDRIRRYTPNGALAGDDIPVPSDSSFYFSVAVDAAGNYIVADQGMHQVVRIAPTGGSATPVYTYPVSPDSVGEDVYVRVDAAGNYILAEDSSPERAPALSMFRISPDGSLVTAIPVHTTSEGAPLPVSVGGMTFDAQGNYVVVDWDGDPEGVYTITPAGATTALFTDTNGILNDPEGIARDPVSGNYFLTDDDNDALYMFASDGSNFTTLLSSDLLDGGPGSVVIANNVPPSTVDYVLESDANIIPVGGGAPVSCAVNVCANTAYDFAANASGNFIIAAGSALAKVTQAGISSSVATAGGESKWFSVAIDGAGNYIVADTGQHQLLKVTPDGAVTPVVAPYPVTNQGVVEHAYVRIDGAGNYILAHDNGDGQDRVFRITPAGVVTELSLSGTIPAAIAGLTFDANGNYVISDPDTSRVFLVTTAGAASRLVPDPGEILEAPVGIFRDPVSGRFLLLDDDEESLFSISADGTQIVSIADTTDFAVAVLSINASPLTITTVALPAGTQGQPYTSGSLTATGGSGSYQWSATGLPAGLSMSLAGVISGTPALNSPAVSSVMVTVTDANNASLSTTKPFQLSIGSAAPPPPPAPPALTISSSTSLIQTKAGGQAAASFTASGGVPPYTFSASGLPPGVMLASGALSGSPSQPGTFNATVTVSDSQHAGAQTPVSIYVLGLTGASLPGGTAGQTYSGTVGAVGGSGGYSFSAAGVPPGLSFSSLGALTGTPTTAGTFTLTVTVASAGVSVSGPFSVTIARPLPLGVTSTSLPDGTINTPYSQPLAAHGGLPPYTWSIIAGSLPAGLSMTSPGTVSGTPTASGTASFGAQVTDTAGATATGTVTLAIHPAPLVITTQSLPSGMATVDYPVQLLAATGGVSPYTWSSGNGTSLPGGMTFSASGALSGVPASAGTYSLAATVTDAAGTKVTATLGLAVRSQSTDLILTASSLQFSLNAPAASVPGGQTVGVQSTVASQPISYTYAVNPAVSWLSVSGGSSTPDTLQVSIMPAALSLTAGDYQTSITATCTSSTCDGHKQTVAVDLTVVNAPPKLAIGTTLLSFATTSVALGSLAQPINIQNTGGGTIGFASVSCEAPWCTTGTPPATLAGGASATIAVTVDPSAVTPGFYRTQADIVSSAGRGSVPVTLFVAPSSTMTLAPAGQQFNMPAGSSPGNPNGSFLVSVNSTSASWTASVLPGAPWLKSATASGSSTSTQPGTVSFSIDPAAAAVLAPGAYYGLIEITSPDLSNSPQDFEAILNVVPASTPLVPDPEPGGLLFITSAGGTLPPQTISVYSGSTSPLTFQTSAATSDGANWLSVTPNTGSAAAGSQGVTTVNVSTSGLKAGVYHGGVSYSLSATAVRTVNATLIVTSAPAAAAAVSGAFTAKAAGCVASKLAPAQTGLVNNFSQPAAWPTPVVIQLSDDCGAAVTNGQVVATFSNGDPPLALPLADPGKGLYSGTWSPRNTGSQISINVRASAPGLADALSQISGAITPNAAPVLTPHGTLHSFDPLVGAALAPGTIVQIYGENLASQTAQPSAIPLPPVLNGTSVIIGGLEAPLYFVSAGQVNAQIPFELEPGKQYQVILSANGALTTPDTIQLSQATPGLAAFADGTLIAQHADGTLVSNDSPAKANEYLVAYGAGMGGTNATPASGAASPVTPLAEPSDPPTLMINGTPSPLLFAGLTPGLVGLYQINFQVPASLAAGNITISVTQDGLSSNETVLPYLP